jgi:hypothetical protein
VVDVIVRYRPIAEWPGASTPDHERKATPFNSTWTDTLEVLSREVEHLGRRHDVECVIQVAVRDVDIRQDGEFRANAKAPRHPGAIVSFDSKEGPLRFSCDRFDGGWTDRTRDGWKQNVRAIALGLEALRKVERYGMGTGHEQYRGFSALPPGIVVDGTANGFTVERAWAYLHEKAGFTDETTTLDELFREAARNTHPDFGGDAADFRLVTECRDLIERN